MSDIKDLVSEGVIEGLELPLHELKPILAIPGHLLEVGIENLHRAV